MNETPPLWPHTGAILADPRWQLGSNPSGGMPTWDAQTMFRHVLRCMLHVCQSVVVVAADEKLEIPADKRVRRIENPHPDAGTLSSLEVLLSSSLDTGYLIASCHQPFLTIPLLRQLTVAGISPPRLFLVPQGTSFHPFPGYYPATLLDTVRQTLKFAHPSMRELIRNCSPFWIPLAASEENHLLSVNSPEQLNKLQHLAGHNNISI
jgi:molybdopterin-guanine dinucleotide biosynthesis protein A